MTGEAFENLRKKHLISRAVFSRWCRLDYSTVRKWERPGPPPFYGLRLLMAYIDKFKAMNQAAEVNKNAS